MKLSDIARNVLNEDAPMSPAQAPAVAQPESGEKFYDVLHDYQAFETNLNKQTEQAKKGLEATVAKNLLNKKVTIRASKGAVGQLEKDYTINVSTVAVNYMNEEYFVVLKDKDKKDYFVNKAFKIKVLGAADAGDAKQSDSPQASNVGDPKADNKGVVSKNVGAMKYPQSMGLSTNSHVVKP